MEERVVQLLNEAERLNNELTAVLIQLHGYRTKEELSYDTLKGILDEYLEWYGVPFKKMIHYGNLLNWYMKIRNK